MKRVFRLIRINGQSHPDDTHPKTWIRYRVKMVVRMGHDWSTRPRPDGVLGKIEREAGKDMWLATAWDGPLPHMVFKGQFARRADAARAVVLHFYPQLSPRCKSRDKETGRRCDRLPGHGSERHWNTSDDDHITWVDNVPRTIFPMRAEVNAQDKP